MSRPRIVIMDMNNLIYRALYVVLNNSNSDYRPYDPFAEDEEKIDEEMIRLSNIITKSMLSMLHINKLFKKAAFIFTFDSDTPSWRYGLYPDYKGNNKNKDKTQEEEIAKELTKYILNSLKDFINKKTAAIGISIPGAEADDIIARVTNYYDTGHYEMIIVSSDHDFYQLINNNISVYHPTQKKMITINGIFSYMGDKVIKGKNYLPMYNGQWSYAIDKKTKSYITSFDPNYELFLKCIRGDTSDNISTAYYRVRETKIKEAFYGSTEVYNNFMKSTWGSEDNPKHVFTLFNRNRELIDLTLIPEDIKVQIDTSFLNEVKKRKNPWVSLDLNKFCKAFGVHKEISSSRGLLEMFSNKVNHI